MLHQLSVLNLIKELIPIGTLLSENSLQIVLNTSGANPTKWPNTLKQFVGKLPSNCLSVFDHFVKLALKGLILSDNSLQSKLYTNRKLISTNKKYQRIHYKQYNVITRIITNSINTNREESWEKFLNSTFWSSLDYKKTDRNFYCSYFSLRLILISWNVPRIKGEKWFSFRFSRFFKVCVDQLWNNLRIRMKTWSFLSTFQAPKKFTNNSRNSKRQPPWSLKSDRFALKHERNEKQNRNNAAQWPQIRKV